jgi:hypothetical protein
MPRDGRALELLVARLEVAASAGGADVRSPDYITGKNSESQREIDVTVRSKVGSTSVLVMLECRDRAGKQDVRWIDEIASKKVDVGADVAVAVAGKGGFTSGAQNAAKRLGVDLRTVDSISVEDVVSWCRMTHLNVEVLEVRAQAFDVTVFADTPRIEVAPVHPLLGTIEVPLDEPIFAAWDARNSPKPKNPELLTGMQLHDLAMDMYRNEREFPRFTRWTQISMNMSTHETPTVAVMTVEGLFPLAKLSAIAEVRITATQVPVTLRAMTDSKGETTHVVEAVADYSGTQCTVSFIRTEDGLAVMLDTGTPVPTPDA